MVPDLTQPDAELEKFIYKKVESLVALKAVSYTHLFQGRQGGFMSSKAQTREKDYERGIRIADRREAIGLSQDELAHREMCIRDSNKTKA